MKVYTRSYEPFRLGGNLEGLIATEVEEFERVKLTDAHVALVVKNPVKKLHHIFLESCGALVWTGPTRAKAIAQARSDAETGNPTILKEQIAQGKKDCESARLIPSDDFFARFAGREL